jgi:hypothetical protein
MGGGRQWWNPFSSPSSPSPEPVPVAIPVEQTRSGQPGPTKKRRTNTVLTTMSGDLNTPSTLNKTLGGA